MHKRFIVTDKDVLTHNWDKLRQAKIFTQYVYEGDPIIGKHQLMLLIEREARQNIEQKYLMHEVDAILEEVVLVKVEDKKALAKIFKQTTFVD